MAEHDLRIHPAPFSDWYATQDTSARGVWLCDRATEEKVKVVPPAEWGPNWSWNITEDGKGVYFTRTGQEGAPTKDEADEN
jgi:hypothetical protein